MTAREGMVTFDLVVRAAFMRGQGMTHDEICRALKVGNKNALITMLASSGVPNVASPGMRQVRLELSNARYADAAAMTRQAGYSLEQGLSEFIGIAAKDRTIRKALERPKP